MRSSRRSRRSTGRFGALAATLSLVALVTLVAGCLTASTGAASPGVSDVWVRPPMGEGRPAAGYLTLVGGQTADALVGASSPVAGRVEIHETVADASGMAAMHPVDRIEIPARATVKLEPGGYHLMLMDVTQNLVPGETIELTLVFDSVGEMTIQAEIRQG